MSAVRLLLEKTERPMRYAVGSAVALHLLFFSLFRAAPQSYTQDHPAPPSTGYLFSPTATAAASAAGDARLVWSPVLFAFPSKMGFSRDLLQERLHTRLSFKQEREEESFLVAEDGLLVGKDAVPVAKLSLSSARRPGPPLPVSPVEPGGSELSSRRIYMAPELKSRLKGGVELSADLNKAGWSAWQALADVTVSEQGTVRHVFLEKPLQPPELNQAVLQTIYRLTFSPAAWPVHGRIEIYSPEISASGGDAK
ncbi:MAG: hypothetical protein K9M45_07730 [Kiritimatiellales bacterium]|nr:hypothetical protein [Kiritimatiellales bacterium]